MVVVCILVLVDVLVLTVWEFVDPLVIEVSNKTREKVVSIPTNVTRSFLYFGDAWRWPITWNSLSDSVRSSDTFNSFRRHLKTIDVKKRLNKNKKHRKT